MSDADNEQLRADCDALVALHKSRADHLRLERDAARVEVSQLQKENERLKGQLETAWREGDAAALERIELFAVRREVSQLRAKIEAMIEGAGEVRAVGAIRNDAERGYVEGIEASVRELRRILTEPLTSTEDPPTLKP